MENITVLEIENKITDKIEQYEQEGKTIRVDELKNLLGWILCDDEY